MESVTSLGLIESVPRGNKSNIGLLIKLGLRACSHKDDIFVRP